MNPKFLEFLDKHNYLAKCFVDESYKQCNIVFPKQVINNKQDKCVVNYSISTEGGLNGFCVNFKNVAEDKNYEMYGLPPYSIRLLATIDISRLSQAFKYDSSFILVDPYTPNGLYQDIISNNTSENILQLNFISYSMFLQPQDKTQQNLEQKLISLFYNAILNKFDKKFETLAEKQNVSEGYLLSKTLIFKTYRIFK